MATLPDVTADKIPSHYSGDTEGFEPEFMQGKLNEVVDQINVRWGTTVESRLLSGALPQRLYEAVVVRIASRVFANEEGLKEEHEGQYGFQTSPLVGSGYLWFTDIDEKDLTGKIASKQPMGRIGTISVGRHIPGGL